MTQDKHQNERGAIAVFMMLILTVIMGFAAMGFDLSYVRLARFEMKNATDAAAHAAMNVLRTTKDTAQARTAAETVAAKNTVLGNAVTLADADVSFGIWDYGTNTFSPSGTVANAVQINGHNAQPTAPDGTVLTTFGRTLGVGSANVAQTSDGAFRPRSIMFEMDITGSFLTSSCGIDKAIAADLAFLDDIYNAGVVKDNIGMDVFTGQAINFTPFQPLNANYTTIKALWQGDNISATKKAHTSGLGACKQTGWATGDFTPCPGGGQWPNEANLSGTVPNISCSSGDFHYSPTTTVYGGTNIGAAIKSGLDTLSVSAHTYEVRSIVVFTDGGPMCCETQSGGGICGTLNGAVPWNPCCADGTLSPCVDNVGGKACKCAQDVYQYGIDEAKAAGDAGIDVYVLAFGSAKPESPRWINYAKLLPQGRGFEVDTIDPNALAGSLLQIANSIPVSLVK
ncbi:MAG TPA: pilus assembly protein TadG-related protein [Polyangia bacterium]|jgi:Flp pilus assembly protein TadG